MQLLSINRSCASGGSTTREVSSGAGRCEGGEFDPRSCTSPPAGVVARPMATPGRTRGSTASRSYLPRGARHKWRTGGVAGAAVRDGEGGATARDGVGGWARGTAGGAPTAEGQGCLPSQPARGLRAARRLAARPLGVPRGGRRVRGTTRQSRARDCAIPPRACTPRLGHLGSRPATRRGGAANRLRGLGAGECVCG